jgi:O-glycosyl hydrolase
MFPQTEEGFCTQRPLRCTDTHYRKIAVMLILLCSAAPIYAGVTVSTSALTISWPGTDTPIIETYTDPTVLADVNYRVLENFGDGRGVCQTFTVPAGQGCTLSKIAIVGKGSSQSATYSIHLYDITGSSGLPSHYIPATDGPDPNTDSFENCTFTTPPGGSAEFIIFTFTGSDMAVLKANHMYAVEIWGPTNVPYPGYWYWNRGISSVSTYSGGDGYECPKTSGGTDTNLPSNTAALRYQLSNGSRDCGLAVYGTLFNGKAYGPEPWDGQEDISMTPLLSWVAGEWADDTNGHDVYLGTDYNDVNDANTSTAGIYLGNTTDSNYQITTMLDGDTVYYWRVDEVNDTNGNSPWKGDVWSFTTTNTKATDPSPADGASAVSIVPLLSWTAGWAAADTNGHDVYFGTDFNDVNDANTSTTGIYIGRQTDDSYQVATALNAETQYHWRIDEINDTNIWKGDVWHFTTAQAGAVCSAVVEYNYVYQQLEGFGAAGVYDPPQLTSNSQSETLYDLMFRDLGLDILRIRNTYSTDSGGYGGDNGSNMTATKTMVAAAKLRNPALKTELVPWSPQASLKSNGSINGGTLAKSAGAYVYSDYGTWWADSLDAFAANPDGLIPDYISIQNEPDWEPTYDGCKFLATESSSYAGYDRAFEAAYNAIYARQGSNMPKMLAPETIGFGSSQAYITALNNRGQLDNIYGFSFHLYGDGEYTNPDGMIAGMENYAGNYGDTYNKPLIMTEYVQLSTTPNFDMALLMAWHIHNTLLHEGATSFYWWTLFRYSGSSTGGLINFSSSSYTIRDLYWFLKAYAYFTDPNWYVLDCTTNPSDNLRMSAFKNPDNNQLTVVILNKSAVSESLTLTLYDFSPDGNVSEVYRSSSVEHWSYLGEFNPSGALTLPAQSITTIHLTGLNIPTPRIGHVTKCKIKAGKIQGQDHFTASGTFLSFPLVLDDINQFDVNIISADGNVIYAESNTFDVCDVVRGKFKYTHKIPRGGEGAITSLKFDFNKQTFSIKAKNIALTGLACPFQLNITLGGYLLTSDVSEAVVNGSKKLIPTRLMRQYKDTLVVTKAKARHSSTKPFSDSLSIKGDIAVVEINDLNMNEPNLAVEDVNIIWGDQTFALLAGDLVAYKTGHRYKCSKVPSDANDGLITAKIDLDKSTFSISVKYADSLYVGPDDVNVDINFTDFNETADVNLVTGRSY